MANVAQLMADRPMLLRLKELEALKDIAGRIDEIRVVVGAEGLLTLLPQADPLRGQIPIRIAIGGDIFFGELTANRGSDPVDEPEPLFTHALFAGDPGAPQQVDETLMKLHGLGIVVPGKPVVGSEPVRVRLRMGAEL